MTSQNQNRRTLLVSIHDVSPAYEDRIARILDLLRLHGIGRGSLLVVPNFHGEWPILAFPGFLTNLRTLVSSGWTPLLHGLTHLQQRQPPARALVDRLMARHLTDREGEFVALTADEIMRRLEQGKRVVMEASGSIPLGFVAPAWLYGEDLRPCLKALGFRFSEGHLYIDDVQSGRRLFCPVLAWASRSRARRLSSRAWARLATPWLSRMKIVRVALHPKDIDHPALVESIRHTLGRLLEAGFVPRTYPDVLDQQ